MRIIHFSDTHFATCPESLLTAFFDKRILGLTNYLTRRRHLMHKEYLGEAVQTILKMSPDVVVCSGDITVIGSEREFAGARELLAPLVESDDFDFIYVPGNHDAYSGARRCGRALTDAFSYLNRGRWHLHDTNQPWELRKEALRFLAVNESKPTNIFLSTGYISSAVAGRLNALLSDERENNEIRVLIGHHPSRLASGRPTARRRRLVGGEMINNALGAGLVDLSLCGHIHAPFVRRVNGRGIELCAGSLAMNGCMAVIDVGEAGGSIVINWISRDGQPVVNPPNFNV